MQSKMAFLFLTGLLAGTLPAATELGPLAFARGGWGLDTQSMDELGTAYLIAHGLGAPVADATASFTVAKPGKRHVWVLTRNWHAGAPGRFRVSVDGKPLPKVFGTGCPVWSWVSGGTVALAAGRHVLQLKDETGFDGRCAGVILNDGKVPEGPLQMGVRDEPEAVACDLVVVGGGPAGVAAALAAARRGLQVALLNDRPVLGGNSSEEIRVGSCGEIRHPVVREIMNNSRNRSDLAAVAGARRLAVVKGERNIDLRLGHRAVGVQREWGRICAVTAIDLARDRKVVFRAPLFVDATGDGWIGCWSGAEYRMGREGRGLTGEPLAPETGDSDILGASIMWNSEDAGRPVAFSAPWAEPEAKGFARTEGEWFWETGLHRDLTRESESVRDHMLAVIYGSFSLAKKDPRHASRRLHFCPFLLGKRESRRLLGDYVLNERDVRNATPFPDAVATGSWSIDLHYDDVKPGVDFITRCDQRPVRRYWIPYRCLYSRNVQNLFVAGRAISATHVAFGSTRVMNTLAQTGVAVGEAAALCKRHGILPREVWGGGFIRDLQDAIGGEWPNRPAAARKDWALVDDETAGTVFAGAGWTVLSQPNGGRTGLTSRGFDRSKANDASRAVYKLPVREAGPHELHFRVPYYIDYLDPAFKPKDAEMVAEVVSGGKRTRVTWNPMAGTGEWHSLGTHALQKGAELVLLPREGHGAFVADVFAVKRVK